MDFDELKSFHKEFAENHAELQKEFVKLFKKWIKKDVRLTMVSILALPFSCIMTILLESKNMEIESTFPEFPDVIQRYLYPIILLKDKWGCIPSKQFAEEYSKIYQSQFDSVLLDEQTRKNFAKWYDERNKRS
jgi:hypothetical protein